MYGIILTLMLVTCFQPHSAKDTDLDSLLESVFGQQNTSEPATPNNSDLDSLITSIFEPQDVNTPSTVKPSQMYPKTNEPCTYYGKEGVCVVYYLCEEDLSKNEGLIDPHYIEQSCEDYLDVCCGKKVQKP